MGQLIKLQDYVSRYEQNIYNYPSRFVRLKKQQWEKVLFNWESGNFETTEDSWQQNNTSVDSKIDEEQTIISKMKEMFRFQKQKREILDEKNLTDDQFLFSPSLQEFPATMNELKHQFLQQLFYFQMKWATSTLLEKSVVRQEFYDDQTLQFFLKRFPDNYLILYKPIFLLKKAPVEVEIILVTPTDVLCISLIEAEDDAVFIGSNGNFWTKRFRNKEDKVLNPIVSVNRMYTIVEEVIRLYEIDFPVRKIVLNRNGYIDYPTLPYDIQLIEKRNFKEWFQRARSLNSPLKHIQLKVANILMRHCQTTSFKRLEWEQSNE